MRISCGALAVLALLGTGCGILPDGTPPVAGRGAQSEALYLDVIAGLRARGLHRAAIAHLDEYERNHARTSATALLRGQSLVEIHDDAAALEVLGRITTGPEAAAAASGIGTIHARAERWSEAVASFTTANRLEPTNPRYLNNLGFALLQGGQPGLAEARLRTAAELDADSAEIRNNLALLMLATQRRADGERMLTQVPSAEARQAIRRAARQIQSRTERRN